MTRPLAVMVCLLGVLLGRGSQAQPLHVEGNDLVDSEENVVVLRGCNLGNWLMIEPWMFGVYDSSIPDHHTFVSILENRFGASEAERLLDLHRTGWIAQRDMDLIPTFGLNAVRIPLHYNLFEDDDDPFHLRDDAWQWIEAALDMAEEAGLYVIFDMHSVQGGQSTSNASGDVTANALWTDPEARERLAWAWQDVARWFKNHPAFAAYDIINEPFGDHQTDHRQDLIDICDEVIDAIREVDPDRPIFIPGALEGVSFYGDPAARGWTGIGFTEHFYPGLFDGNEPTLGVHANLETHTFGARDHLLTQVPVPYLLGEFNPLFEEVGEAEMTRWYYDRTDERGWSSAMWSYKLVKSAGGVEDDNWYMVTNSLPMSFPDIRTASKAEIEAVLGSWGTLPLALDGELRTLLSSPNPSPLGMPQEPNALFSPPATDDFSPYAGADIGEAPAGGQATGGPDDVTLYAGGPDVFGTSDDLRFLSRSKSGNFFLSATLDTFDAGEGPAKAGLMIRASNDPRSAHLFIHAMADGRVMVTSRGAFGGSTSQRVVSVSSFPVGLAIGRQGTSLLAYATDPDGVWQNLPLTESVALPNEILVGMAANAGHRNVLEPAPFADVAFTTGVVVPGSISVPLSGNLLSNPSFETPGGSSDLAAFWDRDGTLFNRETGWVPVRSGNALMGYHHWETSGNAPASISQDVSGLTPGQRYEFSVFVNRDPAAAGKALADRVELRIETVSTPTLDHEICPCDVEELATSPDWSRIRLTFTAITSDARVRIAVYPDTSGAPRDSAVKFDQATLRAVP